MEKKGIHIVGIVGSVRPGNFTRKAMALVVEELKSQEGISAEMLDPADMQLPFPGQTNNSGDSQKLADAVKGATGVILSSPEYHGGISSVIKLVMENMGFPSVLSGKPVGLLGVASGVIGAVKSLEQLRSICSHVGAIVLPGPVSVANVQKIFDENGNCTDPAVEKRIRGLATTMVHYIEQNICPKVALEQFVRENNGK